MVHSSQSLQRLIMPTCLQITPNAFCRRLVDSVANTKGSKTHERASKTLGIGHQIWKTNSQLCYFHDLPSSLSAWQDTGSADHRHPRVIPLIQSVCRSDQASLGCGIISDMFPCAFCCGWRKAAAADTSRCCLEAPSLHLDFLQWIFFFF